MTNQGHVKYLTARHDLFKEAMKMKLAVHSSEFLV